MNPRKNPIYAAAITRTIARYAQLRPADRHYVNVKLRTDPLTRELLEGGESLGNVIDVGCGRGQFGLLLHELGRVATLFGFDWDSAKVAAANAAADGCARFETADLRSPILPPADTILLFDVLQYLSPDEQRQLLKLLVAALRPTGRLLIRTCDRTQGWQAWLSQLLERLGKAIQMNRSHVLTFRSSEELKNDLAALGLRVRPARRGSSALLDNRLWVAECAAGAADC